MQTASPLPLGPNRRRGFTLIEVLMVIAILAILMAFLLPAVMGAMRSARIAQTKTEINNIGAAIQTFKQEFGIEPPSLITIYEDASSWSTTSRALIGRMWPQYDFVNDYDLNGDGDATDTFTFDGAECLVFFLGGRLDANQEPIGFSRNPAMPFSTTASNRLGPFYQFSVDRLIDLDNDGFLEYRDPLNATVIAPYVYFSSYGGSGYPVDTSGSEWTNTDNSSRMTRAYYSSVVTTGATAAANAAASRPFNPNGYQIISAGFDGTLGYGGLYDEGATNPLPAWGSYTLLQRDVERDNITNFSDGVLVP